MSHAPNNPAPTPDTRRSVWGSFALVFGVLATSALITLSIWYVHERPTGRRPANLSDVGGTFSRIFATTYPASRKFQEELLQLRSQGRLKAEDEILINRWIVNSGEHLGIPPVILWCLLFQESRLNHLEGVEGDRASSGIGQFSHYSFYEVNHHLDQYTKDNLGLFVSTMGRDIRPIEARKKDLQNPSSYYFIPTAVAASAVYLNNRYHHLKTTLEKHRIPHDPQLLWFYAAMAYNKGTRSVLSFWNDARKHGGKDRVEKLVLENGTFLRTLNDPVLFTRSLKTIWTEDEANQYAKELKIHMANMKECVLAPEQERSR